MNKVLKTEAAAGISLVFEKQEARQIPCAETADCKGKAHAIEVGESELETAYMPYRLKKIGRNRQIDFPVTAFRTILCVAVLKVTALIVCGLLSHWFFQLFAVSSCSDSALLGWRDDARIAARYKESYRYQRTTFFPFIIYMPCGRSCMLRPSMRLPSGV